VENTQLAVRFYQPVYVEYKGTESVKDADLAKGTAQIHYANVIKFGDWAEYHPGPKFENFLEYYDVRVMLPFEAAQYEAQKKVDDALAAFDEIKDAIFEENPDFEFDDVFTGDENSLSDIRASIRGAVYGSSDLVNGKYPEGTGLGDPFNADDYIYFDGTGSGATNKIVTVDDEDKVDVSGVTAVTAEPANFEAIDKAYKGFYGTNVESTLDALLDAVDDAQADVTALGGACYGYDPDEANFDGSNAPKSETYTLAYNQDPFFDFTTYPAYDATTFKGVKNYAAGVSGLKASDYDNDAVKLNAAKKLVRLYELNKKAFDDYYGVKRQITDRNVLVPTATVTAITGAVETTRATDATYMDIKGKIQSDGATPPEYSYVETALTDPTSGLFFKTTLKAIDQSTGKEGADAEQTGPADNKVNVIRYFALTDADKYIEIDDSDPENPKDVAVTAIAGEDDILYAYPATSEKGKLEKAQEDLTNFYDNNEAYIQFKSYCKSEAIVIEYLKYKLYKSMVHAKIDGFSAKYGSVSDDTKIEFQNAALNLAKALRELDEALTQGIGDVAGLIRTDVAKTGSADNRQLLSTTEAINQLPTVAEADPTMKVYITAGTEFKDGHEIGSKWDDNDFKGSFYLKYVNKGNNTNYPFHLYVPLYVTYSYQNETPAAAKLIYARVTVLSSKDNESEADPKN
jgi:hypothetical protein